jgi:hypothetical protein
MSLGLGAAMALRGHDDLVVSGVAATVCWAVGAEVRLAVVEAALVVARAALVLCVVVETRAVVLFVPSPSAGS